MNFGISGQRKQTRQRRLNRFVFRPMKACSEKMMKERVLTAPEFFLVAVDKETGKIAGFLNGLATDEEALRDEFFKDAGLHDPQGKNIMLLGLDVLPDYRRQGLATAIVSRYLERERKQGRKTIILTCLEEGKDVRKMGFQNQGISGRLGEASSGMR